MDLNITFATPLVLVHQPAPAPLRAIFTYTTGGLSATGENMSSQMQVGSYATVSVEWKDEGGNTVNVEKGTVAWSSSDPATVQISPATGNPAIANLYAPGPVGKVQIHATGDADLGQGVKTVTATYDVEVIEGEAVGGEITFTQGTGQGGSPQGGSKGPLPRK
jgi:hypothetical protein